MDTSEVFSRIRTVFDDGQLLTACASCGRVRVDDAWFSLPRAVRAAIDERHAFSHSICETCADACMPQSGPSAAKTVQEAAPGPL